jgi:hypothetical protein
LSECHFHTMEVQGNVTGSIRRPDIGVGAHIQRAAMKVPPFEMPLEEIRASLQASAAR